MKISLITATFNSEATISCAIDSVASQSYKNIEHLIIDGNSTDATLDVIKKYPNNNIHLVSENDDGIYDALNKGIEKARGEIVGFLHADDFFESDQTLEIIAEAFRDPNIDAVYGDLVYVGQNNENKVIRYWCAGQLKNSSLGRGWMPPHPTFYVRRSVYQRLGGFNKKYKISADYDLMLRFFIHGQINVLYLPKVLIRMRAGGISNRSFSNILQKTLEDLSIVRSNEVGGVLTIFLKNITKFKQFLCRV